MVKAVIGLGNPSPRYRWTRHNLGFLVVERAAQREGVAIDRSGHHALIGEARRGTTTLLFVLPQTYVNRSGEAVASIVRYRRLALQEMLIVCDDLNLPWGHLRLRPRGSDGGHQGLRSIIDRVQSEAFPRLRVGIGRTQAREPAAYVLSRFEASERAALPDVLERSASAIDCWMAEGVETAMNRFNGARSTEPAGSR